jgi:hypothetical protein
MMNKTHQVIDSQTGAVTGRYTSAKAAIRVADRKDLKYGAVRYIVVPPVFGRHAKVQS